jgi:curved DNA-binding protein CbpA
MSGGALDFIYDSEIFVDLYTVLEIDMDAKHDEIKVAYIGLAKKNHPDQGGSSEKFQEITRAYEILYNKETRKEYDLYYLKKSMDEFKGDDILRLKDEYKNFITANSKPITKEELDKLYSETFNEYKDKYKEEKIDQVDFVNRIADIEVERKNLEIENSDDSLANFMKEHGKDINVNDVFEYLKYKNSNIFSNSIVMKEWGTLDSMPGYANGYTSFQDENEYFGSNLYSDISDMNNELSKQSMGINMGINMSNLNINEFINWKNTKRADTKLTESELDIYLKKRQEEQSQLFDEVETNLASNTKRKEVEKFLKTKHLSEDVERYYDELEDPDKNIKSSKTKTKTNKTDNANTEKTNTSTNLDEMLSYMEKIRAEEFSNEKSDISVKSGESDFSDLKSNRELPKINNVRKREFK